MGLNASHQALACLAAQIEKHGEPGKHFLSGIGLDTQFLFNGGEVYPCVFMRIAPEVSRPVLVLAKNGKFHGSCCEPRVDDSCILILFDEPTDIERENWSGPQNTSGLRCFRAVRIIEGNNGKVRIVKSDTSISYFPS